MRIFVSIVFLLLLALACQKSDTSSEQNELAVRYVRAMGNKIQSDSLPPPQVVRVEDRHLSIVPAGRPRTTYTGQNRVPAGVPVQIPLDTAALVKITPGSDGIPLPQTLPAKGKTIPASPPEIRLAKDRVSKDQNPHNFSAFGKLQGLKHNLIHSLLLDKAGNLWIGAIGGGVSKYDGKYFSHYSEEQGLPHNTVLSLLQDRDGNLWFGLETGAVRFDGKTFTWFNTENGLSGDQVNDMLQDRVGNIWLATLDGGVSKYDGENFTHYTTREGLPGNSVYAIAEDRRGDLWFGTRGAGVCRFDGDSFLQFTKESGLPNGNLECIMEDRDGNLWFGTNGGGACRFDGQTFSEFTAKEGLLGDVVFSITQDREGNIWFGTHDAGLFRYDGKYFAQFKDKEGLNNLPVESIVEDRDGTLWLGTDGGGLVLYQGHTFTHLTKSEGLANNSIFGILEDSQKRLWFGSAGGGAAMYDGKQFQHYTKKEGLCYDFVYAIAEDSRGNIWFGTNGGGACKFDGKQFVHYAKQTGLPNTVLSILEDRNGSLWFGTRGGGAARFDPDPVGHGGVFTHFGEAQGLTHPIVFSILEDKQGRLWFATGGGVSSFDGKQVTRFTEKEGVSHNMVLSLLEDSRGNIWFGTMGGGLMKYDGENFTYFTEKEGLSNNFVFSMLEDSRGNLWFGTRFGLSKSPTDKLSASRHDFRSQIFTNFSYEDGFLGVGCWRNSILETRDGTIYIGANDRLTVYRPREENRDAIAPDLQLAAISLFNESIPWAGIQSNLDTAITLGNGVRLDDIRFDSLSHWYPIPQGLSLKHKHNYLSFRFIGIALQQPEKIQYQYTLEGLEQNWSTLTYDNEAHYGNLPPGGYVFKVKARNSAGLWSDELQYPFAVRLPWWRTWWMYALYAFSFLSVLYWLRRIELQKQEQRLLHERQKREQEERINEQLRRVDALKDQFLANTSHELRTPLQGIIGLSESLFEEESDLEKRENLSMIISSGRRLNVLINDILDFSKLRNHEIELARKPVSLHVLADVVLRNLSPIAQRKGLRLINEAPANLPAAWGDENRMQQILYNLAGNGVKFTETGYVRVSASLTEQNPPMLRLAVEDTGIGIPEAHRDSLFQEFEQGDGSTERNFAGTGLGLSISKQLIELHGGTIGFTSRPGEGSTFYCTFPISDAPADETTLSENFSAQLAKVLPGNIAQSAEENAPAYAEPDLSESGKVHILVVDDEPVNQQVLKNYLSKSAYRLTQAMNGEEALNALESGETFDLVLLDVMMPRLSGYEVCQYIRERFLPSELPVIMITAKNQVVDLVQGLNAGANDYLSKPFSKEEFLARLEVHLNMLKINSATRRFVPNEFIRALGQESITGVRLGDHVQQEVTVLFADIRDYTGLSEQMTPEENFFFVYSFNQRMGPIVQRHGGFINQYLGDGFMAIFAGSPEDALHASIEMQGELVRYNARRALKGRQAIVLGIGMHTGSLIMGIIGDQRRYDAATISDTVNTASRMEGLTKFYHTSIMLSEYCLNAMQNKRGFHVRYLGKSQVKGKKAPTDIYECYDGDAPELQAKKRETQALFEEGVSHYFNRAPDQSIRIFHEVLLKNPEDQAARHFLQKAESLLIQGIPDNWTGVEMMEGK